MLSLRKSPLITPLAYPPFRAATPSSSSFLVLKSNRMYLFTSFAVTTFVGHSRVAVCCTGVRERKPGMILFSLPKRQLRLRVKLFHDTRKWCSLSTYPGRSLSTPDGVQYLQYLWSSGIAGFLYRNFSIPRWLLLIRILVRSARCDRLGTRSMYGSFLKHPFRVAYNLSLLWFLLSFPNFVLLNLM